MFADVTINNTIRNRIHCIYLHIIHFECGFMWKKLIVLTWVRLRWDRCSSTDLFRLAGTWSTLSWLSIINVTSLVDNSSSKSTSIAEPRMHREKVWTICVRINQYSCDRDGLGLTDNRQILGFVWCSGSRWGERFTRVRAPIVLFRGGSVGLAQTLAISRINSCSLRRLAGGSRRQQTCRASTATCCSCKRPGRDWHASDTHSRITHCMMCAGEI